LLICRVNAVVVARQGHEAPVFVVFLAEEWSKDFAGPGVPKGHFVLIDSSGALLPVFWNANVLGRDADVARYRGDERLALALDMTIKKPCTVPKTCRTLRGISPSGWCAAATTIKKCTFGTGPARWCYRARQ
jgi:hypothetical protein